MKSLSLRVQVIIVVAILALGVTGALVYIATTIKAARESIILLNRDRLASLSDNLARRYGSVLTFVAPAQIEDPSLAQREELNGLLVSITTEELTTIHCVQAGFFHSLWNKRLAVVGSFNDSSYDRLLTELLRTAIKEGRQQWSHNESAEGNFVIVARPVYAHDRLIGAAWALDNFSTEFAKSWPKDVTPLLQLAMVIGILLATVFVINLRNGVQAIQRGLEAMKLDFSRRLPPSGSELGFISSSINEFADTIQNQQREREALQRKIQHQEKLASLGQLVAGVAHEIRTPLAAIKTRIQLWQRASKRPGKATAKTAESMDLVVGELHRIEQIVRKLLYFSKERKPAVRPMNVHELLHAALHTLEKETRRQKVRVTMKLTAENPVVSMDGSEMHEVFLNLFANALEAMPKGGRLTVGTSNGAEGNEMTIFVEDTGKGIKRDVAPKMFDPFFTTKDTGTGLGLSIAYEIVRSHRGSLESDPSVTRGARFIVTLPRSGGTSGSLNK